MVEAVQDLFVSHASADKQQYVYPLTSALSSHQIAYWIDDAEIAWGDSVVGKINEGLRISRFALVCLSHSFLRRPWPEAEMGAVLSLQNSDGTKRVLPLILNAKTEVLQYYPLIAGLAYREFDEGVDSLAGQIANLVGNVKQHPDEILVTIEGVHTGKLCQLRAPRRASIGWLAKMGQSGMEAQDSFRVSPFAEFRIRWVLVDTTVEQEWLKMSRSHQRRLHALVGDMSGKPQTVSSDRARLDELEVKDGTVFHMYAIEDERYEPAPCAADRKSVV